jgi:hypothetical protein
MEGQMSTLYIKNEAVAEKARRLAKLTGQSITAAVSQALDESLESAEFKKQTTTTADMGEKNEGISTARTQTTA